MTRGTQAAFSRRGMLVGIAGAGLVGTVAFGGGSAYGRQDETQGPEASPDATPVGRLEDAVLTMPEWTVTVLTFQDPYAGTLVTPAEPDPTMRYIGVEVEFANESDQPWNTGPSQLRLSDDLGQDNLSGGVIGSETRLLDVNLPPGEVARGWVYFRVPLATTIVGVVYVPPAPRLELSVVDAE